MITKKRGALCLALLSTLAVLPLSATIFSPRVLAKSAPSSAESELRAIYAKVGQALKRRDINSVLAYETSNFTQKEPDGSVKKRAQADASMRQTMTIVSAINSIKFNITGVKMVNRKAQVSYRQELDAMLRTRDGSKAHFKSTALGRDTWIKTPRGWRVQKGETFSNKSTVNGHPIP